MSFCRAAIVNNRFITEAERAVAQELINAIALVNQRSTPFESMLYQLTLSASNTSALREDLREAQEQVRLAVSANEATNRELQALRDEHVAIKRRMEALEALVTKKKKPSTKRLAEPEQLFCKPPLPSIVTTTDQIVNEDDDLGARFGSPSPPPPPTPPAFSSAPVAPKSLGGEWGFVRRGVKEEEIHRTPIANMIYRPAGSCCR